MPRIAIAVPTKEDILQAIEAHRPGGEGSLSFEDASAVAIDIYNTAIEKAQAEASDQQHDDELAARIAGIKYIKPEGSGIPGANPQDAIDFRAQGHASHDAALAEDVAVWERARAVTFGAITAAASVAFAPGASPAAVGAALLPIVGLVQELAGSSTP
jgi:hypothetical protein